MVREIYLKLILDEISDQLRVGNELDLMLSCVRKQRLIQKVASYQINRRKLTLKYSMPSSRITTNDF